MKPFKLFQYDKKVWEDCENEIDHTWQFLIFKNHSFLWVNYESATRQKWSSGGFHITLSFLSSALFGVDFNNNSQSLSFYFFTEYFSEWNT